MKDRMSMMELQTVMGNHIRALEKKDMTAEEREITLEHAKAVEKIAKQDSFVHKGIISGWKVGDYV